jgi:hypothetical protein
MSRNSWLVAASFGLMMCLNATRTCVDSVENGIAGIASCHLLHRPATPFYLGMACCLACTLLAYGLTAWSAYKALSQNGKQESL